VDDAKFYCEAGYDKYGFTLKYLSDYKGRLFKEELILIFVLIWK